MIKSYFLVFILIFLVTACGSVTLYEDLSESDVQEMLVLLGENGIDATKKKETRQNEVFWSVVVSKSDVVRARNLLTKHNLPRRRELGLAGVYEEKGLIPTPDEQKARFLLAMKGEIINSLESIPGIVDANVVLNVPTKDEFASAEEKKEKRPTASITVKLQPTKSGDQAISESKLQEFVANAVEGLNPRDVTVIISYISASSEAMARPDGDVKSFPSLGEAAAKPMLPRNYSDELVGLKLDEASKDRLKVYLLIFFFILIILSTGLIIAIVQGNRIRRHLDEARKRAGGAPAVEGRLLDEPPRLGGRGGPPERE